MSLVSSIPGSHSAGCSIRRTLLRLSQTWHSPELSNDIDVAFSPRLKSLLGQATPVTRGDALPVVLADAPGALLREMICHEAVHVVVFWRVGANARAHEPEWAELVEQAGYEPRTTLIAELPGMHRYSVTRGRFEQVCPVSQHVRIAKRAMMRWQCRACVESGLPGELAIRRLRR